MGGLLFCRDHSLFPSFCKVLRPAGFGNLSFCKKTATTNSRFPTTTLGNDGYISLFVIPEEFSRGSVVSEENNYGKNRFPTTTLGNDNNNNAGGHSFRNDDQQENASKFNNNF